MNPSSLQIPAATDQYPLSASMYSAVGVPNQQVVLISSAMGVKKAFYADFANYLAQAGYLVYTYDYRGMGESAPKKLKGFEATIQDWGKKDLTGVLHYINTQHPDHKINLVCHSVGGQIAGLAANNHLLHKLVLVASQSGNWRLWDKGKAKVWALWYLLIPSLTTLFGYFPSQKLGLFANLPKGVAQEWARWGRNPEYFKAYIGEDIKGYERLSCPALAYSFEDDFFAPAKASKWLSAQYQNTQMEHRHFTPKDLDMAAIGHFAFFKPVFQTTFWKEITDFLN